MKSYVWYRILNRLRKFLERISNPSYRLAAWYTYNVNYKCPLPRNRASYSQIKKCSYLLQLYRYWFEEDIQHLFALLEVHIINSWTPLASLTKEFTKVCFALQLLLWRMEQNWLVDIGCINSEVSLSSFHEEVGSSSANILSYWDNLQH